MFVEVRGSVHSTHTSQNWISPNGGNLLDKDGKIVRDHAFHNDLDKEPDKDEHDTRANKGHSQN